MKILNKRNNIVVFAAVVLITAVAVLGLLQLSVDYDFEQFFPENDEETAYFEKFRETFESDNDFVLIGIETNDTSVYSPNYLAKIDSLTSLLSSLNHVESVLSPVTLNYYRKDPVLGDFYEIPYITLDTLTEGQINEFESTPGILGSFVSPSRKSMVLFLKHQDQITEKPADTLVNKITTLTQSFNFKSQHFAGRIIASDFYIGQIRSDLVLLVGSSVLLIILFLSITFKRVWGVVIPLIVVGVVVIWTMGGIGFSGRSLNIILNITPTILMVVGISGVIHFLTKYIDELRLGYTKHDALKFTFKEVGIAIFYTSLTTAIGFFTLVTSGVRPVKDFGWITGMGVVFTFLITIFMLPSLLNMMKPLKIPYKSESQGFWHPKMLHTFTYIQNNSKKILLLTALIFAVSFIGMLNLKPNNYVLEELKDSNPLKKDFYFFENNYGGARPIDFSVKLKDTSKTVFDKDVLLHLDTLDTYIKELYDINFLSSPLAMIKSAYQTDRGGNIKHYRIPNSEKKIEKLARNLKKYGDKAGMYRFVDTTFTEARLSGKMNDIGSYKSSFLHQKLYDFVDSNLPDYIDIKITGGPYLMEKNNMLIYKSIIQGLLIAFLIIGIIIGIIFRSFRMVLLSLIPNMLPLIMIAGIMGFVGIDLKLSTSIIFTIAFGIAVDDTIHFLSKFSIELNKGKSKIEALKSTYVSTGKAIVLTTLVLSGGFLTLALSSFGGTQKVGILICLTLVFAVVADLFLLPAIILAFFKEKK